MRALRSYLRRTIFLLKHTVQPVNLRETRAQATVELAVVAPVMIIAGLIVYNLMVFAAATARFDRVAPDLVIAHGVSVAGGAQSGTSRAVSTIRDELEHAMGSYPLEIEVRVQEEDKATTTSILSLIGELRTYACTMRYRPWPSQLMLAGVSLGAPLELVHTREVVVDPWRPGVVV